jgi:hypothetical protein
LESLGFWTLAIVQNSETRKHNVSGDGKREIQLNSFSETLCFLVQGEYIHIKKEVSLPHPVFRIPRNEVQKASDSEC